METKRIGGVEVKERRERNGCKHQSLVPIAEEAAGWGAIFISGSCRGPVADLSGEMIIFGQKGGISYLLIITKCRECQEAVTAAIFTVLMHSQHWPGDRTPGEISLATPSEKNEATDQQTTVGMPVFVLTEWLPPNGNHSGCVFVWDKSKGQGNYQVSHMCKLKCCTK